MKETSIPKGVKFSFFIMSAPLLIMTSYLCMTAPLVVNGAFDPLTFGYIARSCVRLLALNISFIVILILLYLMIYMLGRNTLWFSSFNL